MFIKELIREAYMEALNKWCLLITQKGAEQDETCSVYQ